MTSRSFVKYSSIIAILLSMAGLVYTGYGFFNYDLEERLFQYAFGSIGWGLLLWGTIISFQTCCKYKLEEADVRFFYYLFCGILGTLVCYIFNSTTCLAFMPIIFSQIVNHKKKIIEKHQDLQEGNQKA